MRAGPEIVCLCGSTRFKEAFEEAEKRLTLQGKIVLTVGFFGHRDPEGFPDPETKARLDALHKRKIDLADRVLVLNVGGYVGESTVSEIRYARRTGKPVEYLEPWAAGVLRPGTEDRMPLYRRAGHA